MVLLNTNSQDVKSVCRSGNNPLTLNDTFDDFSIADTVKQSNVTIKKTMNRPNNMNRRSYTDMDAFLRDFFARFRNDQETAERIVNDAVEGRRRSRECRIELVALYRTVVAGENVGEEDKEICDLAINYAFLRVFLVSFQDAQGSAEEIVNDAIEGRRPLYECKTELEELYRTVVAGEDFGEEDEDKCDLAIFYALLMQGRSANMLLPVAEIPENIGHDVDSSVSNVSSILLATESHSGGTGTSSGEHMALSTGTLSSMQISNDSANRNSAIGSTTSMSVDAEPRRDSIGGNTNATAPVPTGSISNPTTGTVHQASVQSMDTGST